MDNQNSNDMTNGTEINYQNNPMDKYNNFNNENNIYEQNANMNQNFEQNQNIYNDQNFNQNQNPDVYNEQVFDQNANVYNNQNFTQNNNAYNNQNISNEGTYNNQNTVYEQAAPIKVDTLTKKTKYKYTVENEKGKKEVGYLDAYNQNEVQTYLINAGLKIIKIEPQNSVLSMQIGGGKLNNSELAFMLTQLSTYLKAGIPLIDAIRILEKQSVKAEKKRIYSNIIYELSKGENFSSALAAQSNVFPLLLINMVKTAELTGDLPEILDDMQQYYDSIDRTRKQAISAMIYPSILFVFAICVLVFIMAYVIPSFVTLFEQQGAELPAVTKIVLATSGFITTYKYWLIGVLLLFTTIFIVLYKKVTAFKKLIQTVIMKLPGFGNILIYKEVTMFTKTFASLLNHNVFITDTMQILGTVSNNEVFKEIINESLECLSRGAKISDAFEDKWAFPIVAYEMLVTGENTGRLPMMMSYVASYYEDLHANTVKRINTFIEPLMIILIAVIVGVVIVSVIVPMFGFYGTVL